MKKKSVISTVFFQVFLIFYAVVSLYPLIWMIFYSLKNNDEIFVTNPFGLPTHLRIENYISAMTSYDVLTYFKNSVVVTMISVIFSTVFALMFAYAVARLKFRGRETLRIYLSLGMFIPVQVIMIPLASLVKNLGISNTRMAVILPYIAFNLSFGAMIFYGFFRTIPEELEEASCMDGATIFQCFWRIIVPIIKPSVATVIIFNFLNIWNEFTMALILLSKDAVKTLPLGLLFFQGSFTTDWGAMGAAMVIASIPTVIVYVLFSSQVENALTVGSSVK